MKKQQRTHTERCTGVENQQKQNGIALMKTMHTYT